MTEIRTITPTNASEREPRGYKLAGYYEMKALGMYPFPYPKFVNVNDVFLKLQEIGRKTS
jgi:hypothetical protein